jgi:ribonuclease-3
MVLQYPPRQKQLANLVQKLGLPATAPISWELLDRALTHSTISAELNYEQLEFVGDSVIRLVTAEFLWEYYAQLPVGDFAAIRSMLVSDRYLARLAAFYNLERYLLASKNLLNDKASEESYLAESFEAVLGALYLSSHSLQLIRPWLDAHLHKLVEEIRADPALQNYKAALQEWTQARYKRLPEYRVQEMQSTDGSDRFRAEVWFQDECLGMGSGRSIKLAEQAAAQVAYLKLLQQSSL